MREDDANALIASAKKKDRVGIVERSEEQVNDE